MVKHQKVYNKKLFIEKFIFKSYPENVEEEEDEKNRRREIKKNGISIYIGIASAIVVYIENAIFDNHLILP